VSNLKSWKDEDGLWHASVKTSRGYFFHIVGNNSKGEAESDVLRMSEGLTEIGAQQ
jgi:hypothetical protein